MGIFKRSEGKTVKNDLRKCVTELTDVMAAFKNGTIRKDEYERRSRDILSKEVDCPGCSKIVTLNSMIKKQGREMDFEFVCPKCSSQIATSIRFGDMPM
jgi:hypothetical protein